MSRKSFFEDRSKLYIVTNKRQLISITETKAPTLFKKLEENWAELEQRFNELNKDKKAGEHKTPVFLYPDLKQYRLLNNGLTKNLSMRVGFGLNDIRVVITEKETLKAIQKFEQKKRQKLKKQH